MGPLNVAKLEEGQSLLELDGITPTVSPNASRPNSRLGQNTMPLRESYLRGVIEGKVKEVVNPNRDGDDDVSEDDDHEAVPEGGWYEPINEALENLRLSDK